MTQSISEKGVNSPVSIFAEEGDEIQYKVTKMWYRYDDGTDTGTTDFIKETMENKDIIKNIELKENTSFPGLYETKILKVENTYKNIRKTNGNVRVAVIQMPYYEGYIYKINNLKINNIRCSKDAITNVYVTGGDSKVELKEGVLSSSADRITLDWGENAYTYSGNYPPSGGESFTLVLYANTEYVGSTLNTNRVSIDSFYAEVICIPR